MSKIKVMVVDDSAFMRKVISNLLEEKGTIEVIATSRNGRDALEKLEELKPDVITLDFEMPVMNGLEFLAIAMRQYSIPIVMLSSLTRQGTIETIQALELGAIDFITKPSGAISLDIDKLQKEIIEKVENAAKCDVSKLKKGIAKQLPPYPTQKLGHKAGITRKTQRFKEIVAIGTSTGGPRALQEVLTKLPADYPAPIFIVQHMPPGFTKSLAERLNTLCDIEVKEAEHEQRVESGVAYIAPGNYHMRVKTNRYGELVIDLDQETQPRAGHRPSVDTLFESIAMIEDVHKTIVIMTGMGSDGTQGLKLIRERNKSGVTAIAEHESTCIVYGMPRSAVNLGLIDLTIPLDQIGKQLAVLQTS